MRRSLLVLLPALLLAAGCSRTVPVTVERIEVQHGPNMAVTTQSDAVLETSVTSEVEGFAVSAAPDDLAALSDTELQAAAQDFLDRDAERVQADSNNVAPSTNSDGVVEQARAFLTRRDRLTARQVRDLQALLDRAASNSQQVPR